MWNMGKTIVLALALGALAQPARSADDLIASAIVDQAREWQQKDRDDLAAELWRKLLRANPTHPEALVKLGAIEVRAGNRRKAEELYARATKLAKPPVGLSQLSAALSAIKVNSAGMARLLPRQQPEPSTPAPTKPKASKPATAKPVESAAKLTSSKSGAIQASADVPVASEEKAQVPAASKATVNEKPGQKKEVDALRLKFSNSIGIAR
jgi:tetratricopeptide (TPR) repeat protein